MVVVAEEEEVGEQEEEEHRTMGENQPVAEEMVTLSYQLCQTM